MKRITGFRLRHQKSVKVLPEAYLNAAARNRLIEKVRAMGESFFTMSEEHYGEWLNTLTKDEFIELIGLE